jgi:chromosome partitioning protein
MHEVFGEILLNTTIPRNIKLAEAPIHKQTIFDYAPDSTGAKAYMDLSNELMERWK